MSNRRPRAALVVICLADGTTQSETFSAEDIASRFAASRVRALRAAHGDANVLRYDYRVAPDGSGAEKIAQVAGYCGAQQATTRLRESINMVVADQRGSWPNWTPEHVVADTRNNLVVDASEWAPGATVLDGDASDPLYCAYRAVLRARPAALEAALRPLLTAYCQRCGVDTMPKSLLCDREGIATLPADRDVDEAQARYEGICLKCCYHNHA